MIASHSTPLSPKEFQEVMGRFASGVTVITAQVDGEDFGTTASAVSSLSNEPPMLLVCLNKTSSTAAAIRAAGTFAVNVLAEDHAGLAGRFATKNPAKFDGVPLEQDSNGSPLLVGAIAHLVCRVNEQVEAGTHYVFLAHVETANAYPGHPLAYFRGAFGRMETGPDASALRAVRDELMSSVSSSGPAASNPAASDPAASGPATSDPSTSDPSTSDPSTSDPSASNPSASNPSVPDRSTSNASASNPAASNATVPDPSTSNESNLSVPNAAGREERIDPEALARKLALEPGSVQHALRALASESLVRREGSYFVLEPVPEETLFDYYAAKLTLELGVAERTVGQVSAEQLQTFRALMEATLALVGDDRFVDPEKYIAANDAFHEYMISFAGSHIVLDVYRRLGMVGVEHRTITDGSYADETLLNDHRALVEAYEAADLPTVLAVLRAHAERPRQMRAIERDRAADL